MCKKMNDYTPEEQFVINKVAQSRPNMIYITITDEELAKIDEFVKEKIKAKMLEDQHKVDGGEEYKRSFTGMMGEVAVAKHFGKNFVDWTVGSSRKYNVADLRSIGYNVGIKTVEMGKFPLVTRNAYRPELICVRKNDNTIVICGLATSNVIRANLNDNFVKSPNVIKRGEKSAFTGFHELIKISSLDELNTYKMR